MWTPDYLFRICMPTYKVGVVWKWWHDNRYMTLKAESFRNADFVINGGTVGCRENSVSSVSCRENNLWWHYPYPDPVVILWQSSVFPVVFQWWSSVFQLCKLTLDCHWNWVLASASVVPMAPSVLVALGVFHCVPIMQINTGLPVEDHWEIASANVVPVQSVQWDPNVLRASGLEVIRSGHFPAWNPPLVYTTGIARVVWAKLISFVLQPQMHKTSNGAHIKGMHRVMLKYLYIWIAELVCLGEQSTPSKSWIYIDLSTCCLLSCHLVISNWYGCYSA